MSKNLLAVKEKFAYDELVDYYKHVEKPRHTDGRRLLDYWHECIAEHGEFVVGRDMPARPVASILRSIVVYEPFDDESDLRVRLAGDSTRLILRVDLKGTLLSEQFSGKDFEHHRAASFAVLRTKRPMVLESSLRRGNVEELHSEIVLLPATAQDMKSALLIVGMFFFG
jgi:hypothetical protein